VLDEVRLLPTKAGAAVRGENAVVVSVAMGLESVTAKAASKIMPRDFILVSAIMFWGWRLCYR